VGNGNGSRMKGAVGADEALVVFSSVSYATKGRGSDLFGLEIGREKYIPHRPKRKNRCCVEVSEERIQRPQKWRPEESSAARWSPWSGSTTTFEEGTACPGLGCLNNGVSVKRQRRQSNGAIGVLKGWLEEGWL
jgi:hypothetical protein